MALTVEITNQQKRIYLIPFQIKRIVQKILKKEGVRSARLSLVFVTDRKIRALNKKFLHHNYPTDVLAFDYHPESARRVGPGADLSEGNLLSLCRTSRKNVRCLEGEIVVSTDAACRQAKEFNSTSRREMILYLAHGILHLLGHDDHRAGDREKMRKKEQEILDYLELGK